MNLQKIDNANDHIKILIVEDLPIYMLSIKSILEIVPEFKVIGEAQDGLEALKKVQISQPDIILMDIGLPKMSGIDATKIIKENYPDVKIIILTSHTDENEVIESLEAGADAYALKDIDTDLLLMLIKSIKDGAFWLDPQIVKIVKHKRPDIICSK